MSQFGFVLVAWIWSLVSSATMDIEKAFLQNDAELLSRFFPPGSFLNLYFAEPISFSDHLSDEQAALWFRRFFRSYQTLGFYPEGAIFRAPEPGAFIFQARWEIQTKDRAQLAFDIHFYFRRGPGGRAGRGFWSILQIRAERR